MGIIAESAGILIRMVFQRSKQWISMEEEETKEPSTWVEEIEIAGSELVERVKELIQEGNVRRIIIRKPNGVILLEIPLTAGVVVGGVVTIFAPLLAAIGAMAALLSDVRVEIVRVEEAPEQKKEPPEKQ